MTPTISEELLNLSGFHIQDMDGAGLITPEIEASLPEPMRERLAEVRATR